MVVFVVDRCELVDLLRGEERRGEERREEKRVIIVAYLIVKNV